MSWSFAIINGRLAEVFFDKSKTGKQSVFAHCYVDKDEYKTKKEQRWIMKDTKHLRFSYRDKTYCRI